MNKSLFRGKKHMLYSYAKLSNWDFGIVRFLGSGLGNLLITWAKFIVFSKKRGMRPIAPTWPQLKIGPLFRGELDKRLYSNLFDSSKDYICGYKKLYLLTTLPKIEYSLFVSRSDAIQKTSKDYIVVFKEMDGLFANILADYDLVRNELIKITLDRHKTGLDFNFSNSISVHVRLGDFKIGRQETRIQWYIEVINKIKERLGTITKVYIFSDGTDEELEPIILRCNAERLFFGSSIADLVALSRSNILVASGNSTFSMWASYLGRMPVIWPPGKLAQKLYFDKPDLEITHDLEMKLPSRFINACISSGSKSTTPD